MPCLCLEHSKGSQLHSEEKQISLKWSKRSSLIHLLPSPSSPTPYLPSPPSLPLWSLTAPLTTLSLLTLPGTLGFLAIPQACPTARLSTGWSLSLDHLPPYLHESLPYLLHTLVQISLCQETYLATFYKLGPAPACSSPDCPYPTPLSLQCSPLTYHVSDIDSRSLSPSIKCQLYESRDFCCLLCSPLYPKQLKWCHHIVGTQ